MLMLALLPLLAQMDPVQAIEEDVDYGDEIVVLDDPLEIYEVEFDDEDDLENFVFEDDETEGLR